MSEHVWIKTAEQPPTEADGWGEFKSVLTRTESGNETTKSWHVALGNPRTFPEWSRIIPPAEPFRITGPGWYLEDHKRPGPHAAYVAAQIPIRLWIGVSSDGDPCRWDEYGVTKDYCDLLSGPYASREEAEAAL